MGRVGMVGTATEDLLAFAFEPEVTLPIPLALLDL